MKKTFKGNLKESLSASPAAAFISSAATPAAPSVPSPAPVPLTAIPEGMRLVPEAKSRRVHLLMRPTSYEWVEAKAKAEGVSVNEKINLIIEAAKKAEG